MLSMIEQSDIIRATSLPNAVRPLNSSNASGTQNKRLLIVYFGKAEVRVASTMTESSVCAISSPNATPITNYQFKTVSVCFQIGAPIANPYLSVCFGEKESGGTSFPYLGTQNKRSNCLFWESGGTCRLRGPQKSLICWGAFNDARHQSLRPCYRTRCLRSAQSRYRTRGHLSIRPYCRTRRYHSRNLVTERDSGFPREFQATLSHEQHETASLIR